MGLLFGSAGAHTYLKSGQVAPSAATWWNPTMLVCVSLCAILGYSPFQFQTDTLLLY